MFFQVTTQDGYILSLQRIPEGRVGGGENKRPAVLIQHGVLVVIELYIICLLLLCGFYILVLVGYCYLNNYIYILKFIA